MDKPRRSSRRRLLVLLAIALVGYEVAIYRHWVDSVPLLPTRVVTLESDQSALGFISPDVFAVANRVQVASGWSSAQGPVQLHEVSGDRVTERLGAGDLVCGHLPLWWQYPHRRDEWYPFLHVPNVVAHHTLESEARTPTSYILDDRRLLYLIDDILHCHDVETNRTIWAKSDVESVEFVKGRLAYVRIANRKPQRWFHPGRVSMEMGMSMGMGVRAAVEQPRTATALLDLNDGHVVNTFSANESFSVFDVSPDAKWIAYKSNGACEVWSVDEGKRVWRQPFFDYGTGLQFSADSQFLVKSVIDETKRLRLTRLRTADGEPEGNTGSLAGSVSGSLVGRRYALFTKKGEHPSVLITKLLSQALRWGLISPPRNQEAESYLFNVETGKLAGTINTSGFVYTAPEGDAFAIVRYKPGVSFLEFYSLPPRPNWTWWILRAVVLPLVLIPVVLVLHRREVVRAGREHRTTTVG